MSEKTEIIVKLCKTCHISKTYDRYPKGSLVCKNCCNAKANLNRVDKNRRYYLKHIIEVKKRVKLYYEAHKNDYSPQNPEL